MWSEKETTISEIKNLLHEGYEVEIDSPDGYVPVNEFVEKGDYTEYILTLENNRQVRCNCNHLFETTIGWKYAGDLINSETDFICQDGILKGKVEKTNNIIPIVDLQIGHKNHRYYSNGVSSHNTNVGKSLIMCHVAANAISLGYNVLYITLEMSEEKIASRIDANLMNIPLDDVFEIPREEFTSRMERIKQKTQGKLIIKEYPTSQAHSGHFRALFNELRVKRNFKPDLLVVDYINICASARIRPGSDMNSYSYIKSIAEELRGLAVENEVPILTGTQTNRSGYSDSDVDMTGTAESFGLPMSSDLMLAVITSEELEQLGQYMFKQLKNRDGDVTKHRKFVVGVDRPRMKLYNVEQSGQTLSKEKEQEDIPVFDRSDAGKKFNVEKAFSEFKF